MPASATAAVTFTPDTKSELNALRKAASRASELLKSLANDHRLLILCMLSEQEMSVKEIGEHVELSQSPLSQHLAKLRAEGLVKARKEAQHVYYSLDSEEARSVIETLYNLYCSPACKPRRKN
ncbi:MAG: ArsR/SmtB family transcription factor [bacterium]